MKKIIFFLLAVISFSAATANIDKRIKEERTVPAFSEIIIKGSVDVIFTQSSTISVVVVGEEEEIGDVITKVSGNALIVGHRNNVNISWFSGSEETEVQVSAPRLTMVSISGSGDFESDNVIKADDFELSINGSGDFESRMDVKNMVVKVSGSGDSEFSGISNNLDIRVNGSGDVECHDIHVANLKVEQYGSGDVSAAGSTKMLFLKQSGSGDFSGKALDAKDAEVNKSGSGDAMLTALESVVVDSYGSGDTYCYGNPKSIRESVNGSGELIIK